MPAKPDVIDDELEPWVAEPLGGSFEIEDALVEGDLAHLRAAGGRIARSRLERTALTGSRLRSLALVDENPCAGCGLSLVLTNSQTSATSCCEILSSCAIRPNLCSPSSVKNCVTIS